MGAGLGSRLNNLANEVLWAMWAGLPLSACTPIDQHNAWQHNFVIEGFSSCSSCSGLGLTGSSCAAAQASWTKDEEATADMKRFIYSKLFKFKQEVVEESESMATKLGLDGVPYVGVHLRRGDKSIELEEDFVSLQSFAEEVEKQCKALKAGGKACQVFVATDRPDLIPEFKAALPGVNVVTQEDVTPGGMYLVRNGDDDDEASKIASESPFLLDLHMLIKSDVFVGTASSNIGRFVFFNRAKDEPSVSLDDEGSFFKRNC